MNSVLTTLRKLPRSARNWLQTANPKLDLLIDKYKLIKVGCLLGVGINCYLIYDGTRTVLALKQVKAQVREKKQLFYDRMENRKQRVLKLMQQLQKDDLLSSLHPVQQTP